MSVFVRATLVVLLATAILPARGWGADRVVDYLYVDANEGGSSGGHVGLRVGDDVFHFEYRRPGLLVLRREPFDEFVEEYARRENRTIEVSRIPVTEEKHRELHDRFRRRHLIQRQHLDALEALRAGRRTLEELRAGEVAIEGAGLFSVDAASDGTLLALRQRVLDTYGAGFLAERRAELVERLARLDPSPVRNPLRVAAEQVPAPTYEFPQRYRDTLTALVAVGTLASPGALSASATITSSDEALTVRDDEAVLLPQLSEALGASLVRLVDSRRPDRGFPLLLGMARLVALERTRASGQWVLVDSSPLVHQEIGSTRTALKPEAIARIRGAARSDLDAALGKLIARLHADGVFAEREFADLEDAAVRVVAGRHRPPHDQAGHVRPALHAALLAPSPTILAESLVAAGEREDAFTRDVAKLYRYHLITSNCVTELLREMDTVLLGDRGGSAAFRDFIPAASAVGIDQRYQVSERFEILPRRREGLARLYEEENPLKVFFRESNAFTSTLYHRNPRDSAFLFFTDDVVVARPLFGAVNLIAGFATSAAGVVTLPFDGGERLRAGVRGAIFSLPELLFQNIRKGSF
jgi:hypothetical protein